MKIISETEIVDLRPVLQVYEFGAEISARVRYLAVGEDGSTTLLNENSAGVLSRVLWERGNSVSVDGGVPHEGDDDPDRPGVSGGLPT